MKKKILLSVLAGMTLLAGTSCEDYNKEYLDEVVTTLYLKNSGEIPLTLYRAGLDETYKIVVDKTGYDLTAETDAKIIRLDQIDLDIYNQEQGTTYKLLPGDCYVLPADLNCRFGSNDLYNTFDLTLKTEVIYDLLNTASDETYVLPLQLVASSDSINAGKNRLFLLPTVEVPKVYFNKTGFINNVISISDPNQTIKLTLPIELIINNQWSFDCTVSVEEALLTDYNTKNNTVYRLLPEDVYTINSTVSFVSGTSLANVEVNIDRTKLGLGTYILPLRLNDVSNEYFEIDPAKNACLFAITYAPLRDELNLVPLTADMITYTSVATNDGGGVAAMIDGKADTYYHSYYSSTYEVPFDPIYGIYLDVALPNPVNSIALEYAARHNNANGAPRLVRLYGSTDKENWILLGILERESSGLPTTAGGTYTSPVFAIPESFTHFRFAVIQAGNSGAMMTNGGNNSFALAELKLWAK